MKLTNRLARIGRRRTVAHERRPDVGPDVSGAQTLAHADKAFIDAAKKDAEALGGMWVRAVWDGDLVTIGGVQKMRLTVEALDPDDKQPVELMPVWSLIHDPKSPYPESCMLIRPCPPGWRCNIDLDLGFYKEALGHVRKREPFVIPPEKWRLAEWGV